MIKKILCLLIVISFAFSLVSCFKKTSDRSPENTLSSSGSCMLSLSSSFNLILDLNKQGINIDDSSEYDICLLIGVSDDPNYDVNSLNVSNVPTEGDIDEALKKHRQKVKDYYSSNNERVVQNLGLDKYNYCVSFYAPCIEIVFDDLEEYFNCENDIINSINKNQELISSTSNYIVYNNFVDAGTDSLEDDTSYPITDAFYDIEVSNTQYTGAGIKIGIIETGYPQETDNFDEDYYSILIDGFNTNQSQPNEHSQAVGSIIGGESGIAKNVYLYFASALFRDPESNQEISSVISNSNLLIDAYDVNIINISHGNQDGNGLYRCRDACIDSIVSNTGCTFVVSAGNLGNIEDGNGNTIYTVGCSMNAITVGAIDNDHTITACSSWKTNDDFLLKPDVVAPGGNISDIPYLDNKKFNGTSFATPMLTGTIALLMEEFPILKVKPALVKSIVHQSAVKIATQSDYYDEYAGFGLTNYQNMRDCLLATNYTEFSISTIDCYRDIVMSLNVNVPYSEQIEINANLIVNSSVETDSLSFTVPSYTDFSIMIYDYSTNSYVAASDVDSSIDYLIFPNYSQSNSSFRIDIVLNESSQSLVSENGAIAYNFAPATEPAPPIPDPPHEHSFTSHYLWQSLGLHRAFCECGEFTTSSHTVRHGSFTSDGYAICLLCRGDVFMGTLNSVPTNRPHTDNGSYILYNGITVLVDEDIESYLNGTLEFYIGEKE